MMRCAAAMPETERSVTRRRLQTYSEVKVVKRELRDGTVIEELRPVAQYAASAVEQRRERVERRRMRLLRTKRQPS